MIVVIRVLRAAARAHLQQLFFNLWMLLCGVFQPFFIAMTVMFMLRRHPDFEPIYVVVGAGLAGLWSVTLFDGTAGIARERWQGTLEFVVAAPVPLLVVTAGRMLGSMIFSVSSMVTSYLVGALVFGYSISVREPGAFAVSLVLGLLSLWSLALLFAPLGILWRTVNRLLVVLEYPVYVLGGFLFPILLLPGWMTPLSYALPPYWAALALHGTSSGELSGLPLLGAWAVLLFSSAAVALVAHVLFHVVLLRAKRDGTLALA